jgi:hypothetical protein
VVSIRRISLGSALAWLLSLSRPATRLLADQHCEPSLRFLRLPARGVRRRPALGSGGGRRFSTGIPVDNA